MFLSAGYAFVPSEAKKISWEQQRVDDFFEQKHHTVRMALILMGSTTEHGMIKNWTLPPKCRTRWMT